MIGMPLLRNRKIPSLILLPIRRFIPPSKSTVRHQLDAKIKDLERSQVFDPKEWRDEIEEFMHNNSLIRSAELIHQTEDVIKGVFSKELKEAISANPEYATTGKIPPFLVRELIERFEMASPLVISIYCTARKQYANELKSNWPTKFNIWKGVK